MTAVLVTLKLQEVLLALAGPEVDAEALFAAQAGAACGMPRRTARGR